ncbi:MAG TPA: hypothetical protein VG225_09810 [Terracidiphilus sp.]|jgi:hypothetical protein|nr:hypothetical protein [Terracidiphilus sp.]
MSVRLFVRRVLCLVAVATVGHACGLTLIAQQQGTTVQKTITSVQHFTAHPIAPPTELTSLATPEMAPMPMVAPLFLVDSDTSSSIIIANNSSIPAGATIEVRDLTGSPIAVVHRLLRPHQHQDIDIGDLLASHHNLVPAGSITVTQDASLKGMTVASQVLITRSRGARPSYIDEELAMTSVAGSATLRAVADEGIGSGLIAVTSIVDWEQHVTIRCLSEHSESKPVTLTLNGQATALLSSCGGDVASGIDAFQESVNEKPQNAILGYELTTDGGASSFSAFGLTPHQRGQDVVYSALPFTDPQLVNSPNSAFAGVPFGSQQALPAGRYSPRLSLTNFSASPANVSVSISTTQYEAEGTPQERTVLRRAVIPARRTIELQLADSSPANGLLQSLFVTSDRKPGEVLGKVVSRSSGELYEIELLNKDQLDENNGGIHPWSVEGDTASHLLLFNYSSAPHNFSVAIWNGIILWNKLYEVAPNETREISINELIADEVPDKDGKRLDPAYQSGVVNWMIPHSGEGTGRLMVTSRSLAMARNFSCGQFIVVCGGYWYSSGGLSVGQIGEVMNFVPEYCDEFSPSQCTGGSPVESGSGTFNWSVGAPPIARFPNSSQQTVTSWPQVYGVGPGGGSGSVQVTAGSCSVYGYGGFPVNPTVNAVNPTPFYVGQSGTMSIVGSGFQNAGVPAVSVSGPSGIPVIGVTTVSDNLITAAYNVPPNAVTGSNYTIAIQFPNVDGGGYPIEYFTAVAAPITQITQLTCSSCLSIWQDSASNNTPVAMSKTVWSLTSNPNLPSVYQGGGNIMGTATFSISPRPTSSYSGLRVEASVPGFGLLVATGVSISSGASSFTANFSGVPSSGSTYLPAQTYHNTSLSMSWGISYTGNACSSSTCYASGSNSSEIYVTLAAPLAVSTKTSSGTPIPALTAVELAIGGGGASTQAAAITNTWNGFAGPANVHSWDGQRALYYYQPGLPFSSCPTSAVLLLTGGNGQCGAWAYLLKDSLAINGISANIYQVIASDYASHGDWLVVNNWTFGTPSISTTPPTYSLPLKNENGGTGPPGMVPLPSGSVFGDLTSLSTLAGQNSTPPAEKVFSQHFIVNAGSTYYDPSYGVTYTGPCGTGSFQANALAGFAYPYTSTSSSQTFAVTRPTTTCNISFNVTSF